MNRTLFFAALLFVVLASACSRGAEEITPEGGATMTIQLTSPVFQEGKPIPVRYTCDGDNVSPPLQWSNLPPGTQSIALLCEDPDSPSGAFAHWVLYGLPAGTAELGEGVPTEEELANGAKQGVNSARSVGYYGPCPPQGKPHRYVFRIYALDANLPAQTGASRADLLRAVQGHILAEGQLMGTYARK